MLVASRFGPEDWHRPRHDTIIAVSIRNRIVSNALLDLDNVLPEPLLNTTGIYSATPFPFEALRVTCCTEIVHSPARVGPLTAIDAPKPALAIGDSRARHVRLTTTGVQHWNADTRADTVPWHEVGSIHLELPTTRWLHPQVADSVRPVIMGMLGQEYAPKADPFRASLLTVDGARVWELDGHYTSGYRRRDAGLATSLVHRLVEDSGSRALMALPADLLARIRTMRVSPR